MKNSGELVLPQDCVSHIFSFTTPRDVCRSSLVSRTFCLAANSNSLWDTFLPSDYEEIVSRSVPPMVFSSKESKKELYFRLCDHPILIDDGNKSFALEKMSGKKCYMVGAREFFIGQGDHPMSWEWKRLPDSRFSEVASLRKLLLLEIHGRMETRMLSPSTTYGAYFVFRFMKGVIGFRFQRLSVSVRLAEGRTKKTVFLDPTGVERSHEDNDSPEVPRDRGDGWMEINMGEFFNDQGDDGEVEICLMEVNHSGWKSGLIFQGIELRPKQESK